MHLLGPHGGCLLGQDRQVLVWLLLPQLQQHGGRHGQGQHQDVLLPLLVLPSRGVPLVHGGGGPEDVGHHHPTGLGQGLASPQEGLGRVLQGLAGVLAAEDPVALACE